MNLWNWLKRKLRTRREDLTAEEAQQRIKEALKRVGLNTEEFESRLEAIRRSEEEMHRQQNGPGGPDDSAGAVRVG